MDNGKSSFSVPEAGQDRVQLNADQNFNLNRRKFFKIFGSGLAVAFIFQDLSSFGTAPEAATGTIIPANQVGAWIHIGEDGIVSVYTGKVEVGQNIRTSLAQVVAEELRTPFSSIKMVMGDTDLVPFDAGTFGSRSTPQMGTQLRKAAATAHQSLLEMAAKTWNKKPESLRAIDGCVMDTASPAKISYGELTKGQQLLIPISDNVTEYLFLNGRLRALPFPKQTVHLL